MDDPEIDVFTEINEKVLDKRTPNMGYEGWWARTPPEFRRTTPPTVVNVFTEPLVTMSYEEAKALIAQEKGS